MYSMAHCDQRYNPLFVRKGCYPCALNLGMGTEVPCGDVFWDKVQSCLSARRAGLPLPWESHLLAMAGWQVCWTFSPLRLGIHKVFSAGCKLKPLRFKHSRGQGEGPNNHVRTCWIRRWSSCRTIHSAQPLQPSQIMPLADAPHIHPSNRK